MCAPAQHSVVGEGLTKAVARAQAALIMMQAAGFIEEVDSKDRHEATAIVTMVQDKKVFTAHCTRTSGF